MGALGTRTIAPVRDRRHVPGLPLSPGGHRPCRGDAGRDVPGPVLAGPGGGRGAQRARRRRRVAGGRHPQRDDVRVHRDHQQAVHGQGRQAQGRALHARERQALHDPARGPAGPGLRRHGRTGQRQEDRQVRRRDHHGRGRRREDRHALGQVRGRAPRRPARTPTDVTEAAPDPRLLGADRRGGDRERGPRVAERRHALPQAGHQEPRGLRGDGEDGHARATSRTGC